MKINNRALCALTLFCAFTLAGCGGGGGSSGGAAVAPTSDVDTLLRAAPGEGQPEFTPAPPVELPDARAQREAENAFEPVPMSPQKIYLAETQTLRVGSLVSSNHRVVFDNQVEGLLMRLFVYDSDGREVFSGGRSSIGCTGLGICPAGDFEQVQDEFGDILDRSYEMLESEGLYNRDAFTFSANRAQYVNAFQRAATELGFTGDFTHNHLGFEHFRRRDEFSASNNPIRTDALERVSSVLNSRGQRIFLFDVDVALFGKRHGTAANRLDYMDFGVWVIGASEDDEPDDPSEQLVGGLHFGVRTPANLIPTTGTATYDGLVSGLVGPRTGADTSGLRGVDGDIRVVADFQTDEITTTFSNMRSSDAGGPDWHNFMFTGTLDADSRNQYTAADVAISNPATTIADNIDLLDNLGSGQTVPTGNLEGRFYGPVAGGETGGRWTLGDTDTIAVGAFGAKRQ